MGLLASQLLHFTTIEMGSSSSKTSHVDSVEYYSPDHKVYYPRNLEDALNTFNILRHRLPSELVLEVLEYAQYWVQSRVERDESISCTESDRARSYLASKPIQDGRLEEIRIDIWSHDQGWSSYRQDHGTLRNSWTWCELGIERPEGREAISEVVGMEIATNVHARSEARHHQIIYRRYQNLQWVQKLQAGDIIRILPKARFPGWENTVEKASIEIYTAPFLR